MKIMLSAGEASGDVHGENIARAILSMAPETELIGFGGSRMENAGVRLRQNFADYSVMGVWEVLINIRRLFKLLSDLTEFMKEEKPDMLVLIDYPDFNWRLAKKAKALGIPVFSYIPPSAWAWRKGRARDCAKIADEFIAIFPHELPVYEAAGAKISFVGNPLVDAVRPELPRERARRFFKMPEDKTVVLLLPGSRKQEIELLLPSMLAGARQLLAERPETVFYLPVADTVSRERIEEMIAAAGVPVTLTDERRYSLMAAADAAMATSGTVVMEAALLGLPCVVLYRLSPVSYAIGKLLVHVDNFSLPNILLGESFQTELLQDEVTADNIAREVARLYPGEQHRQEVTEKLKLACGKLGAPGASGRVAERILNAAREFAARN
ncbi:putative lipid-A-disaccharide synthase [Selenomonas ruminantium subsp. lactilytica TAM6421]|uniref:Lipid-A-disaccharide synthase n=1 Tax=Selenomonas ruminantium subsp. lactilytica (strain NBRC 103574 / TAM6421) TaxID=927704 RepID=I0GU66_SELRL|nr:lipid-A-disaccharide synthase [Selenomonas ruminantium]BAL84303.1 putative lipid-A-disaccharide synthase [Selenomonas ruminantium subsp. lactilytica TAM6421]